MTTYASFISTVSGLTITGVERQFDHIPEAVDTADLPASFVRLPRGGINPETLTTCDGDGKTRVVELVVWISPANQGAVDTNFDATVAMADNLENALDSEGDFMAMVNYEISTGFDEGYWAVIATVTGNE